MDVACLVRGSSVTVEELAGIIQEQTMQLGFAVARYPSKTNVDAAALAAITDERQGVHIEASNTRLNEALGALGTTNLLLHIVGDKVLRLSTLNLETLEPEAPPANFWEELAAKLSNPPQHMAQLHTGFLIYSSKRSELTAQMQATMAQLQQLLTPVVQEQQDLQVLQGPRQADSNDRSISCTAIKHSNGNTSATPSALSTAAAATAAASAAARAPGWPAAPGDMLANMEQADVLLQQLSRQVRSLREASRCLIFQFCNVLDPLQLALSGIHAWPYIVQPPPVLEVLVRQEVARQQREDSGVEMDEG